MRREHSFRTLSRAALSFTLRAGIAHTNVAGRQSNRPIPLTRDLRGYSLNDSSSIISIISSTVVVVVVVVALSLLECVQAIECIDAFLPRYMECRRGIATRILSVRPSVRLFVKRVDCDKTKENQSRYLYLAKDHLA